ncbi:MAG: flagellar hook-length control protein FliK [Defluviitaleaceae bacterium]|nr:flagellar hook-length control protein FliK [Defluviitaleaceae bacterium]
MKIIDQVNIGFRNANAPVKPAQSENNGFNVFLADAGRRHAERTESRSDSRPDHRTDGRERNRSESRGFEAQAQNESTRPVCAPQADEVSVEYAPVAVVEPYYEAEVIVEIDETAVIEKVAEIMQLPVEVVAELLGELDISAKDLTDPKAVVKMLQHALDAENPAELLTNPEFPEYYKAVNEAVAEMQAKAAPAKPIVTNENTVTVNAEGLENLEAVIKDGEVVISEKSGENTSNSDGRQAQTSEKAAPAESQPTASADAHVVNTAAPEEVAAPEAQVVTPGVAIESATTAVPTETTATVASSATPQSSATATDVIEQIMTQVKLTSSGGQFNEIRMTLRPESLGDIVLRVITQNGIVTAQFEAESQRVKELLESDFNQLRDALQEQGIAFSELSVSVRQDGGEQLSQFERARQAARHRAESVEDVSEPEEISYHNGVIDVTA